MSERDRGHDDTLLTTPSDDGAQVGEAETWSASAGDASSRSDLEGVARRARTLARVAGGVAVIATAAAVVFASWWAPLHTAEQRRQQLRAVATDFAVHLATFEGTQIDGWVEETQKLATGNYAGEVDRLFDQQLRESLAELEVVSKAEPQHLFIQELDGGEATVFAIVRQTITNRVSDEPVEDELRMEVRFEEVDARWLVSDVIVLGPSGPSAPVSDEAGEPPADAPADASGAEGS